MSVRPPLTWTYLFPRETTYSCEGEPHWFTSMIRQASASGSCRVHVAWNTRLNESLDLSNLDGLVGVNCSGWSDSALRRAGFTYVSRYAVLPNIQKTRWLVPLESPALSAGGLSVHTPARKSSLLKHYAIRLASRMRLPLWYRHTVVIAHRNTPPILRMLQPHFPGVDLRLALTSGAPEPAHNRKTSIAVLDATGALRAFAKVAGSPLSRRLLEHEADAMAAMNADTSTARRAPKLLFAGDVSGRYMTVQSPLHGKPILGKLTPAHIRFLDSLHTDEEKVASHTAVVAGLDQRLANLLPARPELSNALDDVMPVLERTTVPSTIVHGDFVPWNLRTDGEEISAFDWEYAELDGLPLMDRTHFMIQSRYELDGWTPAQCFAELNEFAGSKPLGYSADQVRAFQTIYLVDHLARLLGENYSEDEHMVHWYRRLLACFPSPVKGAVREAVMA